MEAIDKKGMPRNNHPRFPGSWKERRTVWTDGVEPMTNARVYEIDLLRFLAALAIVLFHYAYRGHAADDLTVMSYPALAPVFKYGYLGVELFFMISGFVILMTAANRTLSEFVIARIVRLYPAFWTCCTITFLVTLAIGEPPHSASLVRYLANMTMLSGFLGIVSIDGAYWSLFIELQFYLLVALLVSGRRIHRAEPFLWLWLLASATLAIRPVGVLSSLLIAEYSAFFIAGAGCFLIRSNGLSLPRAALIACSWGLALFQSMQKLRSFERHFNTTFDIFVVEGMITLFFIVMVLIALRWTTFAGRKEWVVLGAISYPLYLLHQNVGYMVFNVAYQGVNVHVLFWGTIIAALVCAYLVHVLVERRWSAPLKTVLNVSADRLQRLAARSKQDASQAVRP
ncbi:MAG: acyltransferase [Nitrospira sp.]|nr:acyltransferase [Nitrospira sp.]MCP9475349.1 acyltransferase [Nitrospira sp.]